VDESKTEPSALAPNGWPWATLRGFRAGDGAAMTAVYRMHVHDVARLLRHGFTFESAGRAHRFVGYGSAFELHDALHETFRRAFEPGARASYDGIRPYGPYLRTIARNVVLRAFRDARETFPIADADVPVGEAIVLADADSPSAEAVTLRAELGEIVRSFLATLGPADRELLQVRFVEWRSCRSGVRARRSITRRTSRTRGSRSSPGWRWRFRCTSRRS